MSGLCHPLAREGSLSTLALIVIMLCDSSSELEPTQTLVGHALECCNESRPLVTYSLLVLECHPQLNIARCSVPMWVKEI